VAAPDPLLIELPDELLGPRLVVRPYAEGDASQLWEAVDESRAHLAEWMPWVSDYTAPDTALTLVRRFQARWLLREDLVVGVFERASGRLLGGSGLHRIDWAIRRFEIGYWLRQSAVGQGFITEAVQVLTRFAFDRLAANRVEIRMDVRNTRSRAVPERLGFVYEGCQRRAAPDVHGEPRDLLVFALIRDDLPSVTWLHQSDAGPVYVDQSATGIETKRTRSPGAK
jgi:RimJ/RimL family protein N-acetyltransferase